MERGEWCKRGCRWNWDMCHFFVKYKHCRYGDRCRNNHSLRPFSSPPRWNPDDVRPGWSTTPGRVRAAMDTLNICSIRRSSAAVVKAIASARFKEVHPDKHPGASRETVERLNKETAAVMDARETLLQFLMAQQNSSSGSQHGSPGSSASGARR